MLDSDILKNPDMFESFQRRQTCQSMSTSLTLKNCAHHRNSKKSYFSLLNPVKTVHAKEVPESEPKGPTTIERLGQARPSIFITDEEITKKLENESGQDRVRDLFTVRQGELHPDLDMAFSSVKACSFSVFIVTSVIGAGQAKQKFLEKNVHQKFETKFSYARAYTDRMFLGSLKFGAKWAFKSFIFSSIFLLTAQTVATYRNKTSVWEYIAAGFTTGSILRLNLGLKGFVAGGVIGSVLGLAGGSGIYLLLKSANETQEQKHHWRTHESLLQTRETEMLLGISSVPVQYEGNAQGS